MDNLLALFKLKGFHWLHAGAAMENRMMEKSATMERESTEMAAMRIACGSVAMEL